jgi:hypothetical protein
MTGSKPAPEGKGELSRKRTVIHLEKRIRIRMISKYEGCQSLSAITRELGFVILAVNTVVKNGLIRECERNCQK